VFVATLTGTAVPVLIVTGGVIGVPGLPL